MHLKKENNYESEIINILFDNLDPERIYTEPNYVDSIVEKVFTQHGSEETQECEANLMDDFMFDNLEDFTINDTPEIEQKYLQINMVQSSTEDLIDMSKNPEQRVEHNQLFNPKSQKPDNESGFTFHLIQTYNAADPRENESLFRKEEKTLNSGLFNSRLNQSASETNFNSKMSRSFTSQDQGNSIHDFTALKNKSLALISDSFNKNSRMSPTNKILLQSQSFTQNLSGSNLMI